MNCRLMDDSDQQQLTQIIREHTQAAETEFPTYIAPIWDGLDLQDASSVERSVRATVAAISDLVEERSQSLLAALASVDTSDETQSLAEEAMTKLLQHIWDEFVRLLEVVSRKGGPDGMVAIGGSAFNAMRREFLVKLTVRKASFVGGKINAAEHVKVKNTGGRPLAGHWDEMWSYIAVQLYIGDLKPVRQSDITEAMLDWFAQQGMQVGPSSVVKRARILFRRLNHQE